MNKAIFLSLLFLIFPLLAHSQQKGDYSDFLRTNPQFAQELKDLQELNLADIAPQLNSLPKAQYNLSWDGIGYKTQMLDATKTQFMEAKKNIITRLELRISDGVEPVSLWKDAADGLQNISTHSDPSAKNNTALDFSSKDFSTDNTSVTPIQLGKKGGNPFDLPLFKNVRFVLAGEEHSRDLPAKSLIKSLIEYNKKTPKNKRFNYVFVEFAYQLNDAMDFIRAHDGEYPQEELFHKAFSYAKEINGKFFMDTSYHNMARWMDLGYRLYKDNPEVVFYAYDIPGPFHLRNKAATVYAKAIAKNPHGKALFIAGAGHVIKQNLAMPEFQYFTAQSALPALFNDFLNPKEFVSIFITGGEDLLSVSPQKKGSELSRIFAGALPASPRLSSAVTTSPQKYAFDAYFFFR